MSVRGQGDRSSSRWTERRAGKSSDLVSILSCLEYGFWGVPASKRRQIRSKMWYLRLVLVMRRKRCYLQPGRAMWSIRVRGRERPARSVVLP